MDRPLVLIFTTLIIYLGRTNAACKAEDGTACVFPFKDGDITHDACTEHRGRYWCSTLNDASGQYSKFAYCPEDGTCPLEKDVCKTERGERCRFPFKTACVTTRGDKCIFPFTYKDVKHEECTDVDGGGKKWCSLSVDASGNHNKGKYGWCVMEVCKDPKKQDEHNECVPATNEGSEGKGWCATSVGDDEVFQGWGYCKDPKCKGAAASPASPAAPAAPAGANATASNSTAASNSTSNADIKGCLPCALSGILPSALGCLGADIFTCALTKLDASCLIKGCLCELLGQFGLGIVVNILAMIGLCTRPA